MRPWRLQIQRLVDRIAPDAATVDAVNLNDVAKQLGAADILYRTRALDGYTQWSARGPVIQVAMSRSDGRRRATLAHECAHLILDPVVESEAFQEFPDYLAADQRLLAERLLGPDVGTVRALVRRFGLERTCDLASFELLLPRSRMSEVVAQVVGLETLREAAVKHRVSMTMLVYRINECEGDISLLRLQRNRSGTWLVPTMAGAPRSLDGRFVCNHTGDGALDDLGRGGRQTVVTLTGSSGTLRFPGEVSKINDNAALVLCSRSMLEPHDS